MNEEQKAKLKDSILRLLAGRKQDDYLDISRIFKELYSTFDACYVATGELENEDNFVETQDHAIEVYPKDKSVWITPGGRNFIKNNSYESEFLVKMQEFKEMKKTKDEQSEKLRVETRLVKLQLKVFWILVIIAIIGGFTGIIALLAQVGYIHWLPQKELQIEQKQDTTSVSLLPKKEDSLRK